MRFLLLLFRSAAAEAGDARAGDWSKYRQALTRAGVLLAFDALAPGVVQIRGAALETTQLEDDGRRGDPPARLVAYWLIQAKSNEEALEWVKRCPLPDESARIELHEVLDVAP